MINIIVLGNDPEINDIDFNLFKNKNCIISGVNRIFYKTPVDYLLFLDNILIQELENFNFCNTKLITNQYNLKNDNIEYYEKKYLHKKFNEIIHIEDDIPSKFDIFGSICTLILAFKYYIFYNKEITFYLLGTTLKYQSAANSHFWKSSSYNKYRSNIHNSHDHAWYHPRLQKIMYSIKMLKRNHDCNIIGCHNYSKNLKFLPNISMDALIKKIS